MTQLFDQDPMPINPLARKLNKDVGTVYRWGSPHGVRGRRLRLPRIGGRTYVYLADWKAFLNGLNDPSLCPQGEVGQVEAGNTTDAELDAAGF